MKNKETIEEVAKKYANDWEEIHTDLDYEDMTAIEVSTIDFIAGAKWQAERMYSEEDLREAFRQGMENVDYSEIYGFDSKLTEQDWFEKFKKTLDN